MQIEIGQTGSVSVSRGFMRRMWHPKRRLPAMLVVGVVEVVVPLRIGAEGAGHPRPAPGSAGRRCASGRPASPQSVPVRPRCFQCALRNRLNAPTRD